MNYVFIGPPGAGKGTVAKELGRLRPKLRHISTSDLLRAQNLIAGDGSLSPDEMVQSLVMGACHGDNWILDGFPRNMYQARWLHGSGLRVDKVVEFVCSDEVAALRALSRRRCPSCCLDLSQQLDDPFPFKKCPKCGGPPERWKDDTLATIVRRLGIYRSETAPCADYLASQGHHILQLYNEIMSAPKLAEGLATFYGSAQ